MSLRSHLYSICYCSEACKNVLCLNMYNDEGPWVYISINTLRQRQNGHHFAEDTFKCISLNENVWISIKMSRKFVPKGPINNIPSLVQIMVWCHYLNQWWLNYWHIYESLGLNELTIRNPMVRSISVQVHRLVIGYTHHEANLVPVKMWTRVITGFVHHEVNLFPVTMLPNGLCTSLMMCANNPQTEAFFIITQRGRGFYTINHDTKKKVSYTNNQNNRNSTHIYDFQLTHFGPVMPYFIVGLLTPLVYLTAPSYHLNQCQHAASWTQALESISVKFASKYNNVNSQKHIWKCLKELDLLFTDLNKLVKTFFT